MTATRFSKCRKRGRNCSLQSKWKEVVAAGATGVWNAIAYVRTFGSPFSGRALRGGEPTRDLTSGFANNVVMDARKDGPGLLLVLLGPRAGAEGRRRAGAKGIKAKADGRTKLRKGYGQVALAPQPSSLLSRRPSNRLRPCFCLFRDELDEVDQRSQDALGGTRRKWHWCRADLAHSARIQRVFTSGIKLRASQDVRIPLFLCLRTYPPSCPRLITKTSEKGRKNACPS